MARSSKQPRLPGEVGSGCGSSNVGISADEPAVARAASGKEIALGLVGLRRHRDRRRARRVFNGGHWVALVARVTLSRAESR